MANYFTQTEFAAGTVSAPTIYLGGDTTTGVFRSAANEIAIAISSTQRFTFSSTGLQILGTYAQVTNSGASASFRAYTYRDSATQTSINCYCARGSSTTPANLQSGDGNGTLQVWAWTTGTTFVNNGQVRFVATENHSATAIGTKCVIYITPNTTTTQGIAAEFGQDKSLKVVGGFAAWNTTPPASQPALPTGTDAAKIASILTILSGAGLCAAA